MPRLLELALPDQLVPNGLGELVGRRDRHDVRLIYDSGGKLYNLDSPTGLTLRPDAVVADEVIVAFSGADQPPRVESINLKTAAGPIDLKVEQITGDTALVNVGGKLTPLGLK